METVNLNRIPKWEVGKWYFYNDLWSKIVSLVEVSPFSVRSENDDYFTSDGRFYTDSTERTLLEPWEALILYPECKEYAPQDVDWSEPESESENKEVKEEVFLPCTKKPSPQVHPLPEDLFEQNSALLARNGGLRAEINRLESENKNLKTENKRLISEVTALKNTEYFNEIELKRLKNVISNLESKVCEQDTQINELKEEKFEALTTNKALFSESKKLRDQLEKANFLQLAHDTTVELLSKNGTDVTELKEQLEATTRDLMTAKRIIADWAIKLSKSDEL